MWAPWSGQERGSNEADWSTDPTSNQEVISKPRDTPIHSPEYCYR